MGLEAGPAGLCIETPSTAPPGTAGPSSCTVEHDAGIWSRSLQLHEGTLGCVDAQGSTGTVQTSSRGVQVRSADAAPAL